ncbi:phage terminase large subunit family protein, partial [Escherichia coli]|nr:phage terminase large subunit family protein [Escherichia coli]
MNISNSQVNRLRHFVRAGLRSLFRPEPQTAVEWADANYYLPKESAYQEGRWETLPFQRAIMNAMGSDYIREVNVVKSARVGYSKMLLGVYAYFIEHNSAQAAADSQTASANSATAAKKSETNAKNSEAAAKSSETNAKASETNAKSSETNAAKSAADALNYRNQAQVIVGDNIGLGEVAMTCTDISVEPSGYIGFVRIYISAKGYPSVASSAGDNLISGYIVRSEVSTKRYSGLFVGSDTKSLYSYIYSQSSGPQWIRHTRRDELSRFGQNESTTRMYGPTGDRFFEIHTNGSWGVYDSSSGQWSPLGLAQGGTGGRTIEQARANLRVMYEQKAGLANTDLNTLTGEYSGFYQQPTSAYATEELNYPIGLAGALIVLQTRANTASSCVQVYYPYNNPGITYRRIYEGGSGTWSEWKRDVSTERVEEGKETTY